MTAFIAISFYGLMGGAHGHLTKYVTPEDNDMRDLWIALSAAVWPITLPLMLGYVAVGKIIALATRT